MLMIRWSVGPPVSSRRLINSSKRILALSSSKEIRPSFWLKSSKKSRTLFANKSNRMSLRLMTLMMMGRKKDL